MLARDSEKELYKYVSGLCHLAGLGKTSCIGLANSRIPSVAENDSKRLTLYSIYGLYSRSKNPDANKEVIESGSRCRR